LRAFAANHALRAFAANHALRAFAANHAFRAFARDRERRMIGRRIKAAKFPAVKSLDSFDFKAIAALNKLQVLELARCEWPYGD